MICEYCNMYTQQALKKIRYLLPDTKKKFMLDNVDLVCYQCYKKFKLAEHWSLKKVILYKKEIFSKNKMSL